MILSIVEQARANNNKGQRMIYAGYATTGREFTVEQAIQDLGIDAWVARKMEFKRVGKHRRPESVVTPYLPNYIFIELSPDGFHEVQGVKHLAKTMLPIPRLSQRYLDTFKARVQAEYDAQADRAASGERLEQFTYGDTLKVIAGPFMDQLVKFKGTVERARDMHPMLTGEIEIMGQITGVEIDPLHVRATT